MKRALFVLGVILCILIFVLIFRGSGSAPPAETTETGLKPPQLTEDDYIQVAKKFVDLIATYRPEWAERQFIDAKKYLSVSGRSEFRHRLMGSELKKIIRTHRSQAFFVRTSQIRVKKVPARNRVWIHLPGVRQRVIGYKPLPLDKFAYHIELSIPEHGVGSLQDVLITDFRYHRIESSEILAQTETNTQKEMIHLDKRFSPQQVQEQEFTAVGLQFVRLVGNYDRAIALKRFHEARKSLNESARLWFDRQIIQENLPEIKKKNLSQIFFVDPELAEMDRYPEQDGVVVTLPGLRQTFKDNNLIAADRATYLLAMSTESGEVWNPYGIVISEVVLQEPKKRRLTRAERQNIPAPILAAIKRELHEYYREILEDEKLHWRLRQKQERKARKERQERTALILRHIFKKDTVDSARLDD